MSNISGSQKVVDDVACTICGCVCDDLKISFTAGKVTNAERACSLSEPWFMSLGTNHPPAAQIHGQDVSLDSAIARAAEILSTARAPLIYGLSRSSTPGQRAAVSLADRLGAIIDTTASRCHAPSIMAMQEVGESTGSLGEFKNRCDLVVFWGSNPVVTHPRHFERYSVEPAGQFVPRGELDRHLAVVDVRITETTKRANSFVEVKQDKDFEAIWALRSLIRGLPLDPTSDWGADPTQLTQLAARMKSCRSGIIYFGVGLAQGDGGHRAVEALLRLVTDLNDHTRFYARRMRIPGDVAGADSVLCWQTGFPFAVNLNRGYPRYNPGEYSANEALERNEIDACLLVGSEGVAALSPKARSRLDTIPTIILEYPTQTPLLAPHVKFTTAIYGVHVPGTAYRMDETPIPLRAFLETNYPSDEVVLQAIETQITTS